MNTVCNTKKLKLLRYVFAISSTEPMRVQNENRSTFSVFIGFCLNTRNQNKISMQKIPLLRSLDSIVGLSVSCNAGVRNFSAWSGETLLNDFLTGNRITIPNTAENNAGSTAYCFMSHVPLIQLNTELVWQAQLLLKIRTAGSCNRMKWNSSTPYKIQWLTTCKYDAMWNGLTIFLTSSLCGELKFRRRIKPYLPSI